MLQYKCLLASAYLEQSSDLKPAGIYFGAPMERILPMSTALRQEILERDAFMCAYCDGEANCVDHIVPFSYCQTNDKSNLVACCTDCNLIAGSKMFESLSKKREYIRTKRGIRKWKMKFLNRYSRCSICGKSYSEGEKGGTHFICSKCRKLGNEWKL